jgi:Mg/Co/Ni transporter MgtE
MDRTLSDIKREFSTANTVGCILGFLGLTIISATQLTALMPLLFAPLVCGTLGFLLYRSQISNKQINIVAKTKPNASQASMVLGKI